MDKDFVISLKVLFLGCFALTVLISHFSPFWNFEVPTNVIIYERKPLMIAAPHPDIEQLRAQLMVKLRTKYQELCHTREGMSVKLLYNAEIY